MTPNANTLALYASVKELARNTNVTVITAKQVQSPYHRPWVGPVDGPEVVIIDYLSLLTP